MAGASRVPAGWPAEVPPPDAPGWERRAGRVLDDDRAVYACLHGSDVAGLDIQADDIDAAATAEVEFQGRRHLL